MSAPTVTVACMDTQTASHTPPDDEIERLGYSPAEAARVLGIGRSHLYELLAQGRIRSVKLGARRIIPRDAILELLAAE